MPTTLTTICIQIAPDTSTSTTCAPTARKTPTQKTSSDCWPHLMSGRNIGHSRPGQSRGKEPVDEEGKHDEMDEPVGREVGFVVGIERIVKPCHRMSDLRKSPRHRHNERKQQVGAPEPQQRARPDQ